MSVLSVNLSGAIADVAEDLKESWPAARLAALDMSGTAFRDHHGRHVLLRGVNLGGDAKLPSLPAQPTFVPTDFSDHREVSFIGRPAPLGEIDEHLARLARWGFNCVRLLTSWEAVEHAGPGQYDEAYLDYFAQVCERAGRHGLYVIVDFHQDVWSRMSGGDGAPGWTWEAAGLDFTKFHQSGAALVMQHAYDPTLGGRQAAYPTMSWFGNYARPANGIMWTLFFGGADFAPSAVVDGRNIQDFLQDHYLGAVRAVAERVAGQHHVIGFDSLNEPSTGYIGKWLFDPMARGAGPVWSPLDGLAVASGHPRDLPVFAFGKGINGKQTVNGDRVAIWLPDRQDPFAANGAWEETSGAVEALTPDYFRRVGGREVDVKRDYMAPFFDRVASTIRTVRADWMLFAETDPFDGDGPQLPEQCPPRTVSASHWYDATALMTKTFTPDRMTHLLTQSVLEGEAAIGAQYVAELGRHRAAADALHGGAPALIGEFGIPFDLNDARAYRRYADGERDPAIWDDHVVGLDLIYNALDQHLLSSTQWNYTASNRNDPMIGDGWNQEDLSIWSRDQAEDPADPDAGVRALAGFCRPFVRAAQGTLSGQMFERRSARFEATVQAQRNVGAPTEIFVPAVHYPIGFECLVEGPGSVSGQTADLVAISAHGDGEIRIVITPRAA